MDFEKKTGGSKKVQEYLDRIKAGESKEAIFNGLPEVFKVAIEKELNKAEVKKGGAAHETLRVPPQYEGLPSFVLEEIWTIPIYINPEKTKSEQEKKTKVLERLKQLEEEKQQQEEKRLEEGERIEEIKREMGFNNDSHEVAQETPYNKFSVANGETDTGVFWYRYRNKKAKEMREAGQLEWGKERIYFDIKLSDMERLRDLAMQVAGENNIAIAFKYLDEEKTMPVQKDGTETRFVVNFATEADAKNFLLSMKKDSQYATFVSDRNMSHQGIRIDGIAEYASGFREGRAALERIMKGNPTENGTGYTYETESGRMNTISIAEYLVFKKQYDKYSIEMHKKESDWQKIFQTLQ